MNCDMCGKDTKLFRAAIEGAELKVCKDCARFGKIIGEVRTNEEKIKEDEQIAALLQKKKFQKGNFETNERIVENYDALIRKKRESLALTQEEFAKKLNERESIIQKMETGHFLPSIELARKIEKQLGIKLVEEAKEDADIKKQKSGALTIGDLLKLRKSS